MDPEAYCVSAAPEKARPPETVAVKTLDFEVVASPVNTSPPDTCAYPVDPKRTVLAKSFFAVSVFPKSWFLPITVDMIGSASRNRRLERNFYPCAKTIDPVTVVAPVPVGIQSSCNTLLSYNRGKPPVKASIWFPTLAVVMGNSAITRYMTR